MMNHLSDNEIQEFIDNRLPVHQATEFATHVEECSYCSGRIQSFAELNRRMKDISPARVSPDFTSQVMRRIGIKEAPSFAWNVLTNLAPFILVTIVLVIIVTALNAAGTFATPQYTQTIQSTQQVYSTVTKELASTSQGMNEWMNKIFPFKLTDDGRFLTLFVICFFSAIGLMDKYLIAPMWRRK